MYTRSEYAQEQNMSTSLDVDDSWSTYSYFPYEYEGMKLALLRTLSSMVVCFSLVDSKSLEEASKIMDLVEETRRDTLPMMVLVGCKCDLKAERTVSSSEIMQFSLRHNGIPYFETSALDGTNVELAFAPLFTHLEAVARNQETERKHTMEAKVCKQKNCAWQ